MAKLVKSYKGFKIKETTERDNTTYGFWVIQPSWDNVSPVYEGDSLQECIDYIDDYKKTYRLHNSQTGEVKQQDYVEGCKGFVLHKIANKTLGERSHLDTFFERCEQGLTIGVLKFERVKN